MKLAKVEINNFKSLGTTDNVLFVDNINVVVGKNESGKSNIIDAISGIEFVGLTSEQYFEQKNRNTDMDITLKLWFDNYKAETDLNETTLLEIKGYNKYFVSGGLSDYIRRNTYFNKLYNEIVELNEGGLEFSQANNQTKVNKLIEMLNVADKEIFVEPDFFEEFVKSISTSSKPKHRELAEKLKNIISTLDTIYCYFPHFIKIDTSSLKTRYTLKNIDDDLLLDKFLDICNINIEKLKSIMQTSDTTAIRNFERDENKKIEQNFTSYFNDFYSQENISIEFAINSGELCIMIDTSNRYLNYDERSNGLKWYLNIFIQLLHMERKNCESTKNNVILIDEPGVYLHANAQRELYSLFKELTKNENQIIFTTHSPFMLDNKELQNIRSVIKDENGFSHIYNKITTIPTENKSTYDTITPLVYALGLNLNNNIGPNINKKNIVVEGISDYFYLQSYFIVKNISEERRPNIIPSTGADNILPIASILYGWGCDFLILLDQDDKGRSKYDSLKDSNHPFVDKLLFVDGSSIKNEEANFEIENLFSEFDRDNFGMAKEEYDKNKYNYSYLTYNSIIEKEKTFDSETIDNFDKLNLID